MALREDAGTSCPSIDALTVRRTRLLLQMCSMEVEKVISRSSFAGTSHFQPLAAATQSCEDSTTVVPMLETASTESVASESLRL